ncbi:DUF1249 domain-containing protein [Amphritea sp. 1_MG-2023]|uniref:DUF1249 domain-containing protein n=1 Tax=Amphritea sp. 1_MG-2023 TaxID=3062670 RepID=UPI0026E3307A|nr:DUF1249 domain-containing protein [Amphritea sp. 1_MG-2023]MDO6563259.1 DUF1249 domain-containing protein [Amphritea sp. 1_MG-2023]
MKKRYVPDLVKQMADCEANYLRLMRLMPDIEQRDERGFEIHYHQQQSIVRLQVEERFTYTTTVRVSQSFDQHWLEAPSLIVRLYHDARAAEVICRKSRHQFRGVYHYPNDQMHQKDEKAQLNQYLGEWLSHCLSHGQATESVYSFT